MFGLRASILPSDKNNRRAFAKNLEDQEIVLLHPKPSHQLFVLLLQATSWTTAFCIFTFYNLKQVLAFTHMF
nr:unnamed protein product [Callosobruchus chinensis]